jgi:hypothetical protein
MEEGRWLLLLHQIPPKPAYFRAKVLRRLAQVGALSVKNSAYLLPDREDTLEDFEWICQEITQEGGAAWLFRAETLVGMSPAEMEEAFGRLRAPEYEELIEQARSLLLQTPLATEEALHAYGRLSRRRQELRRIDFFDSPLRRELEQLMSEIERKIHDAGAPEIRPGLAQPGKHWVTRKGVKVDRIGSAWLIRRFIDPDATFSFVSPDNYSHGEGQIRFDMFEGEFTHRGELCTFEVLIADSNLASNPALVAIAEIVHDIDLKDSRFQRPETTGVARTIEGLCMNAPADDMRLERGALIFDGLYQAFMEHGRQ